MDSYWVLTFTAYKACFLGLKDCIYLSLQVQQEEHVASPIC